MKPKHFLPRSLSDAPKRETRPRARGKPPALAGLEWPRRVAPRPVATGRLGDLDQVGGSSYSTPLHETGIG